MSAINATHATDSAQSQRFDANSLPNPSHRDPAWRKRINAACVTLLILAPLLWSAEFKPWILFDTQSLKSVGSFLASFWPPVVSAEFLSMVALATWQTIAIATMGVSLAWVLGVPLALLATEHLSISSLSTGRMHPLSRTLRGVARGLLIGLRSVPELVWALLFVRVVGLGVTAGVLAIALTYAGMLGKVYAEILDSSDPQPLRALLHNGAGRLQALAWGAAPGCLPEWLSYTVFRWECAIRGSVIMGFVGAGGLGQQMDLSLKQFAGGEVLTLLLVLIGLVALADGASRMLRRALQS